MTAIYVAYFIGVTIGIVIGFGIARNRMKGSGPVLLPPAPKPEWYVEAADHDEGGEHGFHYVVRLKCGSRWMGGEELDIRDDDFEEKLLSTVAKYQELAATLNSVRHIAKDR